jgi:hypothetical protein
MSHNSNCGCQSHGIYSTNLWNLNGNTPGNVYSCGHTQECAGCIDVIKGACLLYTNSNLTSTGINRNDSFNTVVAKLDAIKAIQDTKNTSILSALNNINDRLNIIEQAIPILGGGAHAPYTLL